MRVDAKKNLKKVATAVLKDPLATRDSIAEKTGLSQGNVSDKLTKLDGIDRKGSVVAIEETDLRIVKKGQNITLLGLGVIEKQVIAGNALSASDIKQIASTAEISQKRYSLLTGENTDELGADKKFEVVNYGDLIPTVE